MSKISLILVMQKIKTNKILNDMTKVQIKPEKFTPFGGLFYVANQFMHHIMPHVDNCVPHWLENNKWKCCLYHSKYSLARLSIVVLSFRDSERSLEPS